MKVLFTHALPFFLAHGGTQTVIEALLRELPRLGVEVEPERWWDERQTGDIIHHVGRPSMPQLRLAQQKGFKVVMTDFFDQTASRSRRQLFLQKQITKVARAALGGLTLRLAWDAYRELDAMIYAVPHEWATARYLFDAPAERGHIIPHGMEPEALAALAEPQPEENYLISVATIAPRKNSVLLAHAARLAKVPIVFVGKPYSEGDAYFREFQSLMDGTLLRYAGFVSVEEKFRLLRGARGFALLSQFESGCIALYEAAAAGLPFFLSNLNWSNPVYAPARGVQFASLGSADALAPKLAAFYAGAHRAAEPSFPLLTWAQVAERYRDVYQQVMESK